MTNEQALRQALEKCRDQFRFYEASHAAKGNLDGDAKARTNCEFAEMCERALATPPSVPAQQGEREGPAPIPNTRLQCFGCKHLNTVDWREPSGDGETFDSGTSATCSAVPTEHGGKSIGAYWDRTREAPKWCPFLPATPPSQDQKGVEG